MVSPPGVFEEKTRLNCVHEANELAYCYGNNLGDHKILNTFPRGASHTLYPKQKAGKGKEELKRNQLIAASKLSAVRGYGERKERCVEVNTSSHVRLELTFCLF